LLLNAPSFIIAADGAEVIFSNVSISDIICSNLCKFIQANLNTMISIFNSSFNGIQLIDSQFFNANDSSIILDTIYFFNNYVKSEMYSQFVTSFINSNSNVTIINSLFESNIISNHSSLLFFNPNDQDQFCLNYSIFQNNQGIYSASYLIFITGSSSSSYKMNEVFFLNNTGFESIIDLQVASGFLTSSNLTFNFSCANQVMHLKDLKYILINSLICSNDNLNCSQNSGPCLLAEDNQELTFINIEISNNIARSNVAGVIITQSSNTIGISTQNLS